MQDHEWLQEKCHGHRFFERGWCNDFTDSLWTQLAIKLRFEINFMELCPSFLRSMKMGKDTTMLWQRNVFLNLDHYEKWSFHSNLIKKQFSLGLDGSDVVIHTTNSVVCTRVVIPFRIMGRQTIIVLWMGMSRLKSDECSCPEYLMQGITTPWGEITKKVSPLL